MSSALLVALAVLSQAPRPSSGQAPRPDSGPPPRALSVAPWQWTDAREQHDAWLDVRAVAQVQPSPVGAAALLALDGKAVARARSPRVQLWELSSDAAVSVLAALESKLPGQFAPVFHDENSSASKLRVPAGGVMIWLHPTADPARFARTHALVVRQTFGTATLLVAAAPGAASLALTQALRADPQVKTVMPNWWFQAHRR